MKNRVIIEISQVFLILFLDLKCIKKSVILYFIACNLKNLSMLKRHYTIIYYICKNIYTRSIFILFP